MFSHTYEVDTLGILALQKLRQSLIGYDIYKGRMDSVFELIRYTYLSTADRSPSIDPLRELVVIYVVCVIEDLATEEWFSPILEGFGSFTRDLLRYMMRRLN